MWLCLSVSFPLSLPPPPFPLVVCVCLCLSICLSLFVFVENAVLLLLFCCCFVLALCLFVAVTFCCASHLLLLLLLQPYVTEVKFVKRFFFDVSLPVWQVKRRKMRATRSVQCSQSMSSFQNPNRLSTSVCERLSSTKSTTVRVK